MCLTKILESDYKPNEILYGWKVFYKDDNGNLHGEHYSVLGSLVLGEWYKSKIVLVDFLAELGESRSEDTYTSGFHSFTTKDAAISWADSSLWPSRMVVKRVLLRGEKTLGEHYSQDFYSCKERVPCVVADEMLILPDEPEGTCV
jgi:hypothetical protein